MGIRLRLPRAALPQSVYPPSAKRLLDAIAPNCPEVSRRLVNDGYCDGSRHLVSFDRSPKPIESVVHLQVAAGYSVQFGQNDRKVIHGAQFCNPPACRSRTFAF
jgi:hypothetical protein